jgi:magnesium-protoporphyrin IX monomethyl ester (oxidative) cyclase
MDVSSVRREWDELIDEMKSDPNKGHFKRNEDWKDVDFEAHAGRPLRKEFIFMVSSVTAEFSGCVLYNEIKRRATNPEVQKVMGYMAATRRGTPASSTNR